MRGKGSTHSRRRAAGLVALLATGAAWTSPAQAQLRSFELGAGGWFIDNLQADGVALRTDIRDGRSGLRKGLFLLLCDRRSVKAVFSLRASGPLQGRLVSGQGVASLRFSAGAGQVGDARHMAGLTVAEGGSFELADLLPDQTGSLMVIPRELLSGKTQVTLTLTESTRVDSFSKPQVIQLKVNRDQDATAQLTDFQTSCILLQRFTPKS
ncbi:hypothetical protein [uncultured Alsobacter sp.]|uniref:hypothetical protein n=1 Tax=uncultured Alsobacter sp. TaxID=1748258 RepID=UPI0025EC356E|nr:hypothetical protein [uncultured Alsobacter sp.]